MANVIKLGGLRLKTAAVDQPLMVCLHNAAERLGIGDPVKSAGDSGQVTGVPGPYTKTVALIASGDPIFGVVEGVLNEMVASSMNLDIRYAASAVSTYVLVRPANFQDQYAISNDGTLATASVGLNANLTGNGGGTTITQCDTKSGQSTLLLDTSTAATTATLQVKIQAFEDTCDNDPASANASVLVTLNNIENAGGTGTIGL